MGVYEVVNQRTHETETLCDFQIMDLMQDMLSEHKNIDFNYDLINLGIAFEFLYENDFSITKKYEIDLSI